MHPATRVDQLPGSELDLMCLATVIDPLSGNPLGPLGQLPSVTWSCPKLGPTQMATGVDLLSGSGLSPVQMATRVDPLFGPRFGPTYLVAGGNQP